MLNFSQDANPSFVMRARSRLAEILWRRDYEVAKLSGAVIWLLWSLALLNPYTSAFDSAMGFRVMAWIAPEVVWGTIGVLLALNEFCSMLSTNVRWRVLASGLLFCWALLIGTMIGLANLSGTGVAVYPGIGLVSGFSLWRSIRHESD